MTHPTSTPKKVVAILGSDALAEGILARLLEREGYATRIIEVSPTGEVGEMLEGVDILLLPLGLDAALRRALVEAMRINPKTAHIHSLSFSAALKVALLDELAGSPPWQSLFKDLVGQIDAALERAAASTRALVVDCCGQPAPQADAP